MEAILGRLATIDTFAIFGRDACALGLSSPASLVADGPVTPLATGVWLDAGQSSFFSSFAVLRWSLCPEPEAHGLRGEAHDELRLSFSSLRVTRSSPKSSTSGTLSAPLALFASADRHTFRAREDASSPASVGATFMASGVHPWGIADTRVRRARLTIGLLQRQPTALATLGVGIPRAPREVEYTLTLPWCFVDTFLCLDPRSVTRHKVNP